MADEPIHLSFGDMLKGIVLEFSHALTLVKQSHPSVTVRSVKLNIGQEPQPEEGQPTDTPNKAALLLNRYPGSEKGWLMEVELGEGGQAAIDKVRVPLADSAGPTALDIFGTMGPAAIKGIDRDWKRILAEVEITRVSQLARMDDRVLVKLVQENRSILPREFKRKARMLELHLPPLPRSVPARLDIYRLLQLPENDLYSLMAGALSIIEIRALIDFLEILNIVLDSDLLRTVYLDQLANH